jgi:hypothetical protein
MTIADYFGVSADYLLGRDFHAEGEKILTLPQGFKNHHVKLIEGFAKLMHESES